MIKHYRFFWGIILVLGLFLLVLSPTVARAEQPEKFLEVDSLLLLNTVRTDSGVMIIQFYDNISKSICIATYMWGRRGEAPALQMECIQIQSSNTQSELNKLLEER